MHPVITTLDYVAVESDKAAIRNSGGYWNDLAYFSLDDMKHFGIENVVIDGYREWKPKQEGLDEGLIRVTLVDDIEKRLVELKHQLNYVD